MKVNRIASQREDGGFDHHVCVGNESPWDVPNERSVQCASEDEAVKLQEILRDLVDRDRLIVGDYFTHARTGVRFVCKAVTYKRMGGIVPQTIVEIEPAPIADGG